MIGAGAFVLFRGELSEFYEGFFPARRMPGERFEINDVETALVGLRSGRRVGIGDEIAVKVDAIEAPRGRVDLSGPGEQAGGRPARGGRGRRRAGARR